MSRKKKTPSAPVADAKTEKTADAVRPVALKRTRIEVAANQLRSAPWNPRRDITPESVADLTASIRTVGLIQPLVVMRDAEKAKNAGDGGDWYLIISGHRRFRACIAAELHPIPCDLIENIDDATARRMTMIENLQRKDANPVMEGELISKLIADGMTQAEIAAETGRGERWVARRKNLMKLSQTWRGYYDDGAKFTTDCLEHIAAYPLALQDGIAKDYKPHIKNGIKDGVVFDWDYFSRAFASLSRNLNGCSFDCTACRTCPNNSATTPDLFDFNSAKPGPLGQCLDEKCYKRKQKAAFGAEWRRAKDDGLKLVNVDYYRMPDYAHEGRKRGDDQCFCSKDYRGNPVIRYGKKPEPATKSEADKEEARKKRERNAALRRLAAWCRQEERGLYSWLCEFCAVPDTTVNGRGQILASLGRVFAVMKLFGCDSYRFPGSTVLTISDACLAYLIRCSTFGAAGAEMAPSAYHSMTNSLSESVAHIVERSDIGIDYAHKLLAFCPAALDSLSKEDRAMLWTRADAKRYAAKMNPIADEPKAEQGDEIAETETGEESEVEDGE